MSLYVLFVWAHIVSAVVLVGYALFWTVMVAAARREPVSVEQRAGFLDITRRAAWPLSGGKLSLKAVGWLLLVAVAVTGILCFPTRFSLERLFGGSVPSMALLAKIVLLAVLAACFSKLGSLRAWPAFVGLAAALASVVASVLLIR
jgi:hypothetical protein